RDSGVLARGVPGHHGRVPGEDDAAGRDRALERDPRAQRLPMTATLVPPSGAKMKLRSTTLSGAGLISRSTTRRSTVASTIFISYSANATPTQRLVPPPNGRKPYGSVFFPKNRSGRKTSGSG